MKSDCLVEKGAKHRLESKSPEFKTDSNICGMHTF